MCQKEFIREQNHLGIKAIKRFILLFVKHVSKNSFLKEQKQNFANVLALEQIPNSKKDKNPCARSLKGVFHGIKAIENLLKRFAQPAIKSFLLY